MPADTLLSRVLAEVGANAYLSRLAFSVDGVEEGAASLYYVMDIQFVNQAVGYALGFFLSEGKIWQTTNGGENWEIIWSKLGESLRMTHEIVSIIQSGEILLRFRVIQPTWDWWWAIDHVKLVQDCPLTQFYPPHNLKLNTVAQQSRKS